MQIANGQFLQGDCLELMRDIPDGSVDMVLCDLPYGTTACSWDSIIPFEPLWEQYKRITKKNAAIVLTASQPFTSALVMSNPKMFKYSWVWKKSHGSGFLLAKKQPIRIVEDVVVFYQKPPVYNPQGLKPFGKRIKTRGFTEKSVYGNLGALGKKEFVQEFTNYPTALLEIPSEKGLHPTQKPVALFEYLIRTYTNPGETVLDNTAGSGTTAVAAERTGRRWICIERDPDYYLQACARVLDL